MLPSTTQNTCLKNCLFVLFVAVVFAPTLFAGFLRVDDLGLIQHLEREDLSLRQIYLPDLKNGLYYRPLIISSFALDKIVSGLNPHWMHAVNILLHVGNSFLVLLIVRKMLPRESQAARHWLAELTALTFAVHPLVTESVNWVSGRTDLLAGLFILISVYSLLTYRQSQKIYSLCIASVSFLLALLSKETSIALLPVASVIIIWPVSKGSDSAQLNDEDSLIGRVKTLVPLLILLIALGGFFAFRHNAIDTASSKISLTLNIIQADWGYSLLSLMGALGFYLKKTLLPWPLNFAIMEIDPVYQILAPFLFVAMILFFLRKNLQSGLFWSGLLFLVPSFVTVFNQIAWTPYGERYLYLTLALSFPMSLVLLYQNRVTRKTGQYCLVILVLIPFIATTLHRNFLWQKEEDLMRQTAIVSPYSVNIRVVYADILIEKGEFDKALHVLDAITSLGMLNHDERTEELMITAYEQKKIPHVMVQVAMELLKNTNGSSRVAREHLDAVFKQIELWKSQAHFSLKLHESIKEIEALALSRPAKDLFSLLEKLYLINGQSGEASVIKEKRLELEKIKDELSNKQEQRKDGRWKQ